MSGAVLVSASDSPSDEFETYQRLPLFHGARKVPHCSVLVGHRNKFERDTKH